MEPVGPETELWERAKEPPVETLIKHGVQYNDVQIKT